MQYKVDNCTLAKRLQILLLLKQLRCIVFWTHHMGRFPVALNKHACHFIETTQKLSNRRNSIDMWKCIHTACERQVTRTCDTLTHKHHKRRKQYCVAIDINIPSDSRCWAATRWLHVFVFFHDAADASYVCKFVRIPLEISQWLCSSRLWASGEHSRATAFLTFLYVYFDEQLTHTAQHIAQHTLHCTSLCRTISEIRISQHEIDCRAHILLSWFNLIFPFVR